MRRKKLSPMMITAEEISKRPSQKLQVGIYGSVDKLRQVLSDKEFRLCDDLHHIFGHIKCVLKPTEIEVVEVSVKELIGWDQNYTMARATKAGLNLGCLALCPDETAVAYLDQGLALPRNHNFRIAMKMAVGPGHYGMFGVSNCSLGPCVSGEYGADNEQCCGNCTLLFQRI